VKKSRGRNACSLSSCYFFAITRLSSLVGGTGEVMLEILFIKAALVTGWSPYVHQ